MWYSKEIETINTLLSWSRLFEMLKKHVVLSLLVKQIKLPEQRVRLMISIWGIPIHIIIRLGFVLGVIILANIFCHTQIIFNFCRFVKNDKNTWLKVWPLVANRLYILSYITVYRPGIVIFWSGSVLIPWPWSQSSWCWWCELLHSLTRTKCNNRQDNLIIENATWLSQTTAWLRSTRQAM